MNAGRRRAEFGKVEDLMYGFFGSNNSRMSGIHVVGIGGNELAGAMCRISILDAEILDAQPADRRHHPAILVAMIVNAAHLAYVPADSEHFEQFTLVDQIPGVVAVRVK